MSRLTPKRVRNPRLEQLAVAADHRTALGVARAGHVAPLDDRALDYGHAGTLVVPTCGEAHYVISVDCRIRAEVLRHMRDVVELHVDRVGPQVGALGDTGHDKRSAAQDAGGDKYLAGAHVMMLCTA